MFKKDGYDTKGLSSNVALGVLDGLDSAIWAYAYATIAFTGFLSAFLPVGIFVILVGWALVSLIVTATSALKTNMASTDEQAIVIIGSIGALLVAEIGPRAGSSEGLANMLAVMGVTSLAVAGSFFLVRLLRISRFLELIPYPVICGFMAGIAWLMLDAAIFVATDASISSELLATLKEGNNLLRLVLSAAGGAGLVWFINRIEGAWALPVASAAIILAFYAAVGWKGLTTESLVADGWLFDIKTDASGIREYLGELSISQVDPGFIVSVIPEIATIVFLVMLGAAMSISTSAAVNFDVPIRSADEMKNLGIGNFLCALVCSPPGYTDAVTSTLYQNLGATSRWMPIASSVVLLVVAVIGFELISYMPTVFVASTVFMFAFQMFKDWMYENVRKFGLVDYFVVCFILAIVIAFGMVEAILAGILVTGFMFILRYSMISAIQGQYTLDDHRSSVERSASSNRMLNRHGGEGLVFTLRGFLFFGTTNLIRDTIKESIETGAYATILLDLRRVTGIDVSALQTLQQIKQYCETKDILLMYARIPEDALDKLLALDAVSRRDGEPLIFSETDFAMECMEEIILAKYAGKTMRGSVRDHLFDLMENEKKADLISGLMKKVEIGTGDHLFRQGDRDDGFYMVEAGFLSASIDDGSGGSIRVKKFSPGSVIGELSSYTAEKKRTASVVADEPSVLYHLDPAGLSDQSAEMTEAQSAIHEMVARTLSTRIDYMNRRLIKEIV